jgi:hypothetical protein
VGDVGVSNTASPIDVAEVMAFIIRSSPKQRSRKSGREGGKKEKQKEQGCFDMSVGHEFPSW